MLEKLKRNLDKIEYIMLAILFIFIVLLEKKHTMWLDELDWGVGILIDNHNLKDIYLAVLKTGENLPFFYFTIYLVKVVFGYNEFAFVLESIVISFIGVWGIIKITRKFFNKYIEFFSVFFIFTSYIFIAQCALQVRPYALLFCFSAWTLYLYLKRISDESWKNIIKYGICMIFLMYSHWFGVLISLCYAIIDFILFLEKKTTVKSIISYIIGGLAFLPSFIILLQYHNGDVKDFGIDPPTFWTFYSVFRSLVSYMDFNIIILIIAIIYVLVRTLRNRIDNLYISIITVSLSILIFCVFTFSIINPRGSLIRDRYFVTILPHISLLMAWFTYKIINKVKNNRFFVLFSWFIFTDMICMLIISFYFAYYMPNVASISLYSERSKYLSEQDDAYFKNTLIIHPYGKTWVDYYFTNKDIPLPSNIIVVNPLKYANTLDQSKEDIDMFEYCVKDGIRVNDLKVDDIKQYETIYYCQMYRNLSDELYSEIIENYTCIKIDGVNILKFVKKLDK